MIGHGLNSCVFGKIKILNNDVTLLKIQKRLPVNYYAFLLYENKTIYPLQNINSISC